jgi:hypothetical protein
LPLSGGARCRPLPPPLVTAALEDRPGALGEVSRRLGDAGVNITLTYLATDTRLVLAADNLAAARTALGK